MAINLTQVSLVPLSSVPADLGSWYAPDLLLNIPFEEKVVSHPRFEVACQSGFYSYFENLIGEVDGIEVFVKGEYSWDEIVAFLTDEVFGVCDLPWQHIPPFAWTVGFCLGWLSALALFALDEAERGHVVLVALLRSPVRTD